MSNVAALFVSLLLGCVIGAGVLLLAQSGNDPDYYDIEEHHED